MVTDFLEVLGHENQINGAQQKLTEDQNASGHKTSGPTKAIDPLGTLLVGNPHGLRHGNLRNSAPSTALRHVSYLLVP